MSILSGESTFMPDIEFGGISKLEGRRNSNLVKLLHINIIGRAELKFLKPIGFEYLHLHGLTKIHKPNVRLRLFLSLCRSPHNLAKLLNPIQTRLCKYSVKDSFELVDHLGNNNIKGKTMCSFDVTYLFTNVPLEMTIEIFRDQIFLNGLKNNYLFL
ncbi:unnamed protein product [Schistosoma margrebowiei]|uniref:Reverse transcriptase domain-containing protein n=1 Tax=Schistosoma margrebowiei TaxID=48269 RepID=A0AA84ZIE4_9TREM|nr:unnamed protein product [Schistosoma margrebowiei]